MSRLKQTIGFIGGGNMAEAIVGALIRSGLSDPSQIFAGDISSDRRKHLEKTYAVSTTADNMAVFTGSDIVILAVKPQVMAGVLEALAARTTDEHRSKNKLIISIAAGVPIQKIEQTLYAGAEQQPAAKWPIVRVMPNTPALVLTGMSGISANDQATENDRFLAETIFKATGEVLVVPEASLNAVTAVSGSGPAYVFFLIEAMIDAAVSFGLSESEADLLTRQTLKGALKLLEESGRPPGLLRQQVTSPGGTTEAALNLLQDRKIKEGIMAAMAAACRRAEELSR